MRQAKRRVAHARAKAPQVGPYVVRRLFVQAEIGFLDEQGQLRDVTVTEPKQVCEADFVDWHWAWMKAGGLDPQNVPAPKQEKKTG